MPKNDPELERLRAEMDAAQRQIDSAKQRLDYIGPRRDAIKREIESVNYRIADLKHSIDIEYEAIRACRQAHNKIDADNHRWSAQDFKAALDREYSIKNGYFEQLSAIRSEFEPALAELRSAQERKRRAREAFQARLAALKAANEASRAKWHEKPCSKCGKTIRYHEDWARVPDMCKECRERERAMWHEKPCAKCGRTIRYREDWAHIPNICKDCKSRRG